MAKIQILSAEIANKIAAGEVVERPASVVKELVDNAVDAGASQIDIEIKEGGTRLISVSDNGEGMDEEDLLKCWQRHGTSKIKEIDDLWRVMSMGFRGEALASIAAVSKVTIKSKQKGEVSGKEITVLGGKSSGGAEYNSAPASVGMPEGTKVVVEDLFYNVPARKKFLKTAGTELRHIIEVVNDFALVWLEVGFSLKHNGKQVLSYFATPGVSEFSAPSAVELNPEVQMQTTPGVGRVLGERFVDGLLPVRLDHPHLQISGWIGKPQLCHEVKYKQWLFVNKRRVRDMGLNKVIKQAYGTLLPARVYPVYVLYLDLPPEMVDVNVHPRKEEVKFVNSQLIYSSVIRAVKYGLEAGELGWTYSEELITNMEKVITDQDEGEGVSLKFGTKGGTIYNTKKNSYPSYGQRSVYWDLNKPLQVSEDNVPYGTSQAFREPGRVIQIHNLYLVIQSENGLVIVDQHAAHERVMYEKFVSEFKSKNNSEQKQELLIPLELELLANERQTLEESMSIFENLGFEIELKAKSSKFKATTKKLKVNSSSQLSIVNCKLLAVPVWAVNKNLIQLIKEVLHDIEEDTLVDVELSSDKIDDQSLRVLTYMACRSAVKAGDRLSEQEMRHILESLDLTQEKYTCPHGRPVKVEFSMGELERMFKRSGF